MPKVITTKKRFLSLCFFMSFITLYTFAQTSKVDELLGQLNKNNPDTTQIKIMRKLSAAYSAVDPIKKFYYANQYRLLAEKNDIDSVVASAYLDMGISYGIRSKTDSALYYFNLGFQKAKESNYVIGIARSYANIGYAYDRLDRKKEAVKNYEESLKIYRKLNIKKAINQNITNLGSIYFDLGEYAVADIYFRQVLENVKETPNDELGLGNALFSLGNSNRKLGNAEQSLDFYQQSLAVREKIGDLNGIALSNWGIGLSYINKKDFHKALGYLEIALRYNRSLKNIYQECAALMSVAHAYLGLKDYKNAEETAKLALLRAKETSSKGLTAEALELMVEVSNEQKKFDDALRFQAAYTLVNDSLNVKKTTKEVIASDVHRINAENKTLESDNKKIISKNTEYATIITIITLLLVLVAILLILYYRRNQESKNTNLLLQKQKQETAEVNEELAALNEELTMQMSIVSMQNVELEKLNHVKNKFFSIVSHDLRSPLNSLKMLFEMYRKGDLNEEELSELLTRLEDNIYNTATFLDNLLEWSKSQLEGMVVSPSQFKINDIVDDNIKLMDSQIKLKSITIENKIAADVTAYADPNMIDTVVRNLLSNAIKFCNIGDQVIFDAQLNHDQIMFSITDSGPGISDSDQKNLFNLSHTISTANSGEKGYQIGLVLCKDMLLQNNGDITVESELGKGATFFISLPVA